MSISTLHNSIGDFVFLYLLYSSHIFLIISDFLEWEDSNFLIVFNVLATVCREWYVVFAEWFICWTFMLTKAILSWIVDGYQWKSSICSSESSDQPRTEGPSSNHLWKWYASICMLILCCLCFIIIVILNYLFLHHPSK